MAGNWLGTGLELAGSQWAFRLGPTILRVLDGVGALHMKIYNTK